LVRFWFLHRDRTSTTHNEYEIPVVLGYINDSFAGFAKPCWDTHTVSCNRTFLNLKCYSLHQ
jgi:hypothetical protein